MATFTQRGDKWRVQVRIKAYRVRYISTLCGRKSMSDTSRNSNYRWNARQRGTTSHV
ncbi:hypothetical protein [Kingella negevensis]|uniref:hypothetical protein n=1 Tax=Kingella negevensis TaxID=1522312 RepID=UPI00255030BA|nr:hypothetical protein [Kingella negevensis]MDK4680363.1 hypothetical protein [Kingella negevensis]MDK4690112.1 hypothetical protein [Kingella negevensis]MDK4692542.1 hypothetical protein [Kingella negevensis]MDK4698840.1 hypothetical protein [Kingella negevensis]